MGNDGMVKPWGDILSSGPRTAVGTGINETGAFPKSEYPKGSGGVAPLSHAGMCSGARSD